MSKGSGQSSNVSGNVLIGGAVAAFGLLGAYTCKLFRENRSLKAAAGGGGLASASLEHNKAKAARAYETKKMLNDYLLMHFGENLSGNFSQAADGSYPLDVGSEGKYDVKAFGSFEEFDVATGTSKAPRNPSYALNFPKRVAELAMHFTKVHGRALDVGCSVGRTAFELTPKFGEVIGVDYSEAFVEAAKVLASGKGLPYAAPIEGVHTFNAVATLGAHVKKERVRFEEGDAGKLDVAKLGKFDCIVGANLIDRLPSPRAFLALCVELINSGGVLVLTSPYTWMHEFTPQTEWLGGRPDDARSTFEALQAVLEPNFKLEHQSHMPFLIRETGRKNQFTFAHATVWRRK